MHCENNVKNGSSSYSLEHCGETFVKPHTEVIYLFETIKFFLFNLTYTEKLNSQIFMYKLLFVRLSSCCKYLSFFEKQING